MIRVESYDTSSTTIDYYEFSITASRQIFQANPMPGLYMSDNTLMYGNNSELITFGPHSGQYGSISYAADGDWGEYNSGNGYGGIRIKVQ